jgi:alpha-N-arabinofuranosidase
VAGIHFNIFNNHAERVFMANIAQTINVLQSVILTEGPRMILTPTYHVFDMYQVHQDAMKLPVYVESESAAGMPALSASVSEDENRKIHISLTNIDPAKEQDLKIDLRGCTISPSVKLSGKIISAENMGDHNTFEKPDTVKIADFNGASLVPGGLELKMPPMSVVTVELA